MYCLGNVNGMFQWKNRAKILYPEDKPYDWGYSWGAIISDGSLYHRLDKQYARLAVTDYDFARLFSNSINQITGVRYKITPDGNNYIVAVTCEPFVSRLTAHISIGSRVWEVPNDAFRNSDIARGFLNGYLDGDGSVTTNNRGKPIISFTSVNLIGLGQVCNLLSSLGIYSMLYPMSTKQAYEVVIRRFGDVCLYRDKIGVTMKRKHDKLDTLIALGILR